MDDLIAKLLGAAGVPGLLFFGLGAWWMSIKIKESKNGHGTGKLFERMDANHKEMKEDVREKLRADIREDTRTALTVAIGELELSLLRVIAAARQGDK